MEFSENRIILRDGVYPSDRSISILVVLDANAFGNSGQHQPALIVSFG